MKSQVQGKEERILEFYLYNVNICKDLDLSFDDICDHILQLSRSKELTLHDLARIYINTTDLLVDLLDYENLLHKYPKT